MRQQNNMAPAPNPPEQGSPPPEVYAGVNFPYRGTELHGVLPTSEPVRPEEAAPNATRGVPIKYEDPEDNQAPVPVVVVNEARRELRRWRPSKFLVNGIVAKIANRHEGRQSLTIRNLSSSKTVWIGETPGNASVPFGYAIPPNTSESFSHEDEVYAVSEDGTDVSVTLYSVYSVPTE